MNRRSNRWTFLTLALLLAPLAASSQSEPSAFSVRARAQVEAGGFSGEGVRKDVGGIVRPRVELTPELQQGALRLALPIELAHRQTVGASLNDSRGSVGLDARWRFGPELRLGVEGTLIGVWRPQWSDLFQPLPSGELLPTDRYSHLDKRLKAHVAGIPLRHQHARLEYRYTDADYVVDPAFEPLVSPTHLAPFNFDEHALEASWRYLGDGFKAGAGLSAFRRADEYLFARDARTGYTHAGAGGAPPNPKQVRVGLEPKVEGELELADTGLEVSGAYGLEIVEDVFEGYYSFTGHHPEVELKYRARGWEVALKAEAFLRNYGDNSYAEGGSHPPLTFGDRRVDQKLILGLGVEVPVTPSVVLTGDGALVRRVTNFPDYEPYFYPVTRGYDIDWSYTNLRALVGLRWTFDGSRAAADD